MSLLAELKRRNVMKPGVAACGFSGERSIEPAGRQMQSWLEAEGWGGSAIGSHRGGIHRVLYPSVCVVGSRPPTTNCRERGVELLYALTLSHLAALSSRPRAGAREQQLTEEFTHDHAHRLLA